MPIRMVAAQDKGAKRQHFFDPQKCSFYFDVK